MMNMLVQTPWWAGMAAVVLGLLWVWRHQRAAAIAGAAWALYCGYEYLMHARVLCSGECNIRVDLLLIYPVLGILTVYALVRSLVARRR